MSIAVIAPYEELRSMALELIAERKYPARVYLGDMEEGCAAARRALQDGARILVSRGGTAVHIRKHLGVDVLEVRPSVYSAFAYIHSATTAQTRIAVVGFNALINVCRPVCDILRRQYATFELQAEGGFTQVIDNVCAWKPDIVIGDAISVRLARDRSLRTHLIESSRETLVDALEQGLVMYNNLNKHLSNEKKLSVVLGCTREGALLFNGSGEVEEVNPRGCSLLHMTREDIIGRHYDAIFPAEEIKNALARSADLKNVVILVRGRRFVVDLVNSPPDMEANSAVLLFQRVEHVQQTESTIRTKLMDQGFCARYTFQSIVHASAVMTELIATARSYSGTDCNVMIQGETGTGKELFAQSIHNAGPRSKGPFVAVNCAALPGTLLESELFGYVPGAFTGALRSGKTGLFELAHNGTLFLDEVSEMDIFLQSRLLRTLQTREIMRIGDNKILPVNVRVIAATNRKPQEEVRQGRMRGDLFFRLNVLDLTILPLRERRADIPVLFAHYLKVYGEKYGVAPRPLTKVFARALEAYSWPGNVRELENLAEKYVILGGLSGNDLLAETGEGGDAAKEAPERECQTLDEVISCHVHETLRREKGNIARAAASLGVDRNTVKRWLAKGGGRSQ